MDFLWLVLLCVLGLVMIVDPVLLWKLEHLFTVKGGEPTELYLGLTRVGGVIFLVLSVVMAIFSFLG